MKGRFLLYFLMLTFSALFSMTVMAADQYKVVKVESWDTLNMRSGPGTKNGVIGELPYNATGVGLLDRAEKVGKTLWVEVSWKGQRGWVSKSYLNLQSAGSTQQSMNPTSTQQTDGQTLQQNVTPQTPEIDTSHIVKKKRSGMWILECGNGSPFWRVEVLPEWLRGTLGDHKTGMPITQKRQKHGKYHNVAVETEVRGANKWNRLRLTLRYNRSCYSTLAKKKVAFSVEGSFNNQEIAGCCRSYQVK